ncbi:chloride channel protein [Salinisphaera sp. USBA-960]|uniref:chloride channel protein n=1 Tax=Salinisphaera orenii TaxID=856731 RepID=UPI000DBE2743|nr:chloride channel protein [Salifodinibacter halophilus]NNC26712.1 chloride channel protein [Salifodinibacter halophilus]
MARPRRIERSNLLLAILAVGVGITAGYGAGIFRKLIALVHNLAFAGELSPFYDSNAHTLPSIWGVGIIAAPILGSLVVTFLIKHVAPEIKGPGVSDAMDAIYYRGGVIRWQVGLARTFASSIQIGTGGSVGREGPIMQIGSAIGSGIGQLTRIREWQRDTLIAAGASAAIAATFNTPLGGLLFAIEIILPETSSRTLIPVALATGSGTFIGRLLYGDTPLFDIPALANGSLTVTTPQHLAAYVVFGVLVGLCAWLYTRSIFWCEDLFNRLPSNDYVRHALGMALVGVITWLFLTYTGHYYVQGLGYATIRDILDNALTSPTLLLLLLAAKLLVTSLTLGSGGAGGVFTPSLYLGATLGAVFAIAVNALFGSTTLDPASTAVLGMAGLVAGSTGAALTAIAIIFEITRDYHIIIPMIVVVSIAFGVRHALLADTIYSFKLTRRGHPVPDSLDTNIFMLHTAAELYDPNVACVGHTRGMAEIRRRFKRFGRQMPYVLVLGPDHDIQSIFSARRRFRFTGRGGIHHWSDEHRDTEYIVVAHDDLMFDVVGRLRAAECEAALVTTDGTIDDPRDVLGVITMSDIARSSRLARQMELLRGHESSP